jgi:osmoprotectant transport system ATP-binding protein
MTCCGIFFLILKIFMAVFLKKVSKYFKDHRALEPTTLTIGDGKTTVLIGPNGCGKSTLLRLIVGLIPPTEGQIFFDFEEVNDNTINDLRKKIGYVIQEGGLFPHLNVKDNISLFARFLRYPSHFIEQRITFLCELVKLPPNILNSYPLKISGGERQRVSLMRALMLNPDYILLDEPLAALDPVTRFEMQTQLKQIFSYLQKTVILVTHDMREAAFLGNEIILMCHGKIIQKGSFQDLIRSPKEPFVTVFIQAQQYSIELA